MGLDENDQLEKRRKEYLMEKLQRENPTGKIRSRNVINLGFDGPDPAAAASQPDASSKPQEEKAEPKPEVSRPIGPDIYHQRLIEESYQRELNRRLGGHKKSALIPIFLLLIIGGIAIDGRLYDSLLKSAIEKMNPGAAKPGALTTNAATSSSSGQKYNPALNNYPAQQAYPQANSGASNYAAYLASQKPMAPAAAKPIDGSDAAGGYESAEASKTTLRAEQPEGTWARGNVTKLIAVQAKVRNVGKTSAKGVRVWAKAPGGIKVALQGPGDLASNQSYLYMAQTDEIVRVAGNLEIELSCDNCRR